MAKKKSKKKLTVHEKIIEGLEGFANGLETKNKRQKAAPTEKSTYVSAGLVRLRKRHKLSQRAAAAKCGIPQHYWSRYETGTRNPSAEVVEKIAKVFGTTASLVFKAQT